jgi:hypothetical protein
MKNLFICFITTLIFVNHSHVCAKDAYKSPEAISRVHNQITVGVFPEVELISILQTISEYPTHFGFLMSQNSFQYKTDVMDHFESFEEHPAVLMFDRLSLKPGGLNFSAPSNIMLYTDKSLHLREDIELDDFVVGRAGGMDSLKVFLNLLGDFAAQSSFNEFFESHRDYYLKLIDNTVGNLGSTNYIAEVETFYGKKQKSYNIILVSLYNGNGFGNSLLCANDQRELYNTMGPFDVIDNVPFFGDENYLSYMIRHEFSHPFINPLTEKHWDYLKDYAYKFDSIPEVARKKVCGEWQECVNEFTIRAITTHLAYKVSDQVGLRSYEREKSRGVSNLDSLLNKISYYQSDRETYPTLDSYYLTILDVFKEK